KNVKPSGTCCIWLERCDRAWLRVSRRASRTAAQKSNKKCGQPGNRPWGFMQWPERRPSQRGSPWRLGYASATQVTEGSIHASNNESDSCRFGAAAELCVGGAGVG